MRRYMILALIITLTILLSGCGPKPSEQINEVSEKYGYTIDYTEEMTIVDIEKKAVATQLTTDSGEAVRIIEFGSEVQMENYALSTLGVYAKENDLPYEEIEKEFKQNHCYGNISKGFYYVLSEKDTSIAFSITDGSEEYIADVNKCLKNFGYPTPKTIH